jgi:ubiquinone/menaquinone biosynthesis C-methylase UbiE
VTATHIARRLDLLRCPATGESLEERDGALISVRSGRRYELGTNGVPLFAREWMSDDARVQEAHYDRIASTYLENLTYGHTEEYMAYFDRALLDQVNGPLDTIIEVCCGAGEACWLLRERVGRAVGVDVSTAMLARARARLPDSRFEFAQGDACRLPVADAIADAAFMLGGVHHVNDRARLFGEVFRVLKPGGRLYFREPLDDFILWRLARRVIYRLSPTLDAETERPLRKRPTCLALEQAGFRVRAWRSLGFIGCCLLMNSDVLVFNRLFRFMPGIRSFTRFMTAVDDATLRLPGLRDAGVAVIGVAVKP